MHRSRSKLPTRSMLLFTLPLLASSCTDTPTTAAPGDTEGELTRSEALALAGQLGLEGIALGQNHAAVPAPTATSPALFSRTQTVTVTYSLTRPCFLGGTVDSSGRIAVRTDTLTDYAVVDITATEVHHACVFLAGTTRVTVWGDPDVTATIHAESLGGEAQGTQSVGLEGGLRYTTDDGRSGRCAIDILVEANPTTAYESTRGSFCGFVFDVTVEG